MDKAPCPTCGGRGYRTFRHRGHPSSLRPCGCPAGRRWEAGRNSLLRARAKALDTK